VLAQRRYKVRYPWKKIFLSTGLAATLFILLNDWNPEGTLVHGLLVDSWLPAVRRSVDATPLGDWKDGKIGILLAERTAPLAEAAIKGSLAALFALVLPLVHDGTRNRMQNLLSR